MTRPAWLPDNDDGWVLFTRDAVPDVVEPAPSEESIEGRFRAFHTANPWVATALERLAADMLARGARKVGVKMLYEVIRWQHTRVSGTGESPRLNNDYTARYARLLVERHPEWETALETRRLRTQ